MLPSFSTFRVLSEAVTAQNHDNVHLKHLNHPEENIFQKGAFEHSLLALRKVHESLAYGKKTKDLLVSTKIDGAPSLVFGIHPITKKFFVGTKSVFNKKPKINYTVADIDENHGHAPGLAKKLKEALATLKDIIPSSGGVYQGDVLFGPQDKKIDRFGIHFKPNTIEYTVDKSHKDYRSVAAAKFGIAVHTKYQGKPLREDTLEGMYSTFDSKGIKLKASRNVHQSDLNFDSSSVVGYPSSAKVEKMLDTALSKFKSFSTADLDALEFHGLLFKTYINSTIRDGSKATVQNYEKYAEDKLQKEVDKLKSAAGKERKEGVKMEYLGNLKANRGTLSKALDIHDTVQKAKDLIVDAMNTSKHQYQHSVNGKSTSPEGFVATAKGVPIKLVHRHEFSKLNFDNAASFG